MSRISTIDELRDDLWERLKEFIPGGSKGKRGPRTDNRKFVNALLWMAQGDRVNLCVTNCLSSESVVHL
jgi:transposase